MGGLLDVGQPLIAGVVAMLMSIPTWRRPSPPHFWAIATGSSSSLTVASPAADPPAAPSIEATADTLLAIWERALYPASSSSRRS